MNKIESANQLNGFLNGMVKHAGLKLKYRIIVEQDEDGIFVAEAPSLPGCVSQGNTRDEALVNVKEAIEGYLESLRKHGDPIPPPITEEMIEVV